MIEVEGLGSSCLSTVQLACIKVVTCGLSLAVVKSEVFLCFRVYDCS